MVGATIAGLYPHDLKLIKVVTLQLISAPNWKRDVEAPDVNHAGGSSSLDAILLRERSRRLVHRTS
jgi:hypothetical protein